MILNQMALFMCFRMSACRIYKIGMTKHSPEVRAKEISASTGVPKPFKVIAAFIQIIQHQMKNSFIKPCKREA